MRKIVEDVMPVRCAGCAYTEGTEANQDVLTTTTRELCEMGRIQFYCHANAVNDRVPEQTKKLCHGFAEVMVAEVARGYTPPHWKQVMASEGLRMMEEAEESAKRGDFKEPDQRTVIDDLIARVRKQLGDRSTPPKGADKGV